MPKSIEEVRGGEASPLVQQVVFDGKPQVIDGGSSMAWRQINPNTYERKRTENGKPLTTRTLTLSTDGKTLTEKTNQTRSRWKAEDRHGNLIGEGRTEGASRTVDGPIAQK